MEWVETRGRTVEEAKDRALDQLGVGADEAEFEVLEEPKTGFLGLRKSEARVRARVRPRAPRPKVERRSRTSSSKGGSGRSSGEGRDSRPAAADGDSSSRSSSRNRSRNRKRGGSGSGGNTDGGTKPAATPADTGAAAVAVADEYEQSNESRPQAGRMKEKAMSETEVTADYPIVEQEAVVREFLDGVLKGFGLEGEISTSVVEGALHGEVNGPGLGLLIGPRGGTLRALQELGWTTLQRSAGGRSSLPVRLDVAGFVQKRRVALEAFARSQAEEVRSSGTARALEPMNSADRKVVHDALVDAEGVRTASEGDDPYRRVVILPA